MNALVLTGSGMLIWSAFRLMEYLLTRLPDVRLNYLFSIIISMALAVLGVLLLFAAYTLAARVFGWRVPFLQMFSDSFSPKDAAEEQVVAISSRNSYILILAALCSFYVLFLQESIAVNLYWTMTLPVLILLVEWKTGRENVLYVLGTLGILLFLCTVKLSVQNDYNLLSERPIITASLVSYALVTWWVWHNVKHVPGGESLLQWRLILTFLLGSLCIFYFHAILTTINCLFDQKTASVAYQARIEEKCPPYGSYIVSLSYTHRGKRRGRLLTVSRPFYYRIKEGDTITLHLHPGLLGWAWYHDGMGEREVRKN